MPEFDRLLEQFLRDELTPEELSLFLKEARDPANLLKLRRIVAEKIQQKAYTGLSDKEMTEPMFSQMLSKAAGYSASDDVSPPPRYEDKTVTLNQPEGKTIALRRHVAIVAASLLLSGIGMRLWLHRDKPQAPLAVQKQPAPLKKNDVEPGGNKATLTLSDGSTINLTGAGKGLLARQGNARVVKLNDGQLSYQTSGETTKEILYNTMSTPRGGQYRLGLPDGSQVWLNASSSITYPTAFTGGDRTVTMTGEAYFEVARNAALPFRVITKAMQVDVLGTHFNVNAYADEMSASATLLEGAVRVHSGDQSPVTVKPGQQVVCGSGGSVSLVDNADLDETVAWKEGLFSFNGADLPSIMRQLARWYDLDVRYEGRLPKRHFTGKVFRNLKLSETLKVLELNQIHFRLEGNRLTVTP
jgi:ferric-dicitrate binding protein FerR (iron transport regulator)